MKTAEKLILHNKSPFPQPCTVFYHVASFYNVHRRFIKWGSQVAISQETIQGFQQSLENHSVYSAINSTRALQIFMQHHIYSVWDFMSLIKYLQQLVAPATYPWLPAGDSDVKRFINELVLEEESDVLENNGEEIASSHFELYCQAMEEVGADTSMALRFVEQVRNEGIQAALSGDNIPEPSRQFTAQTFAFIDSGNAYEVAAALALGREHIIPNMFRVILKDMQVSEEQAPMFHYYLKRHIHLYEDFHAPLSLKLLDARCGDDPANEARAVAAAEKAVAARIQFWDGVEQAIKAESA